MNMKPQLTVPPEVCAVAEESARLGFGMPSEPEVGALLGCLAASKPQGDLLELGTGTGIGTAWLLSGMDPVSRLVSVDVNEQWQAVARRHLGPDPRVEFVLQDGVTFLEAQLPSSFDLVFADAMPGKYEALDLALRIVKSGGFYVIDDLLPQPNWPEGHADKVPSLIKAITSRRDWSMVHLDWASGVLIAVKRSA